jgi:hypothetical protein
MRLDGAGIRIEPVGGDRLVEERDRLVIAASGATIDDDEVSTFRHADQR